MTMIQKIALAACLIIIGFFLWTEHRAHLYGILPYILLLACPFMHFFMHGSHKDDTHHHSGSGDSK